MTLTISLLPETENQLRHAAARQGLAPEVLAKALIEQGLKGEQSSPPKESAIEEILAPFRKEVEESGMTDDELRDLFTEARDEVRAERRAKRP